MTDQPPNPTRAKEGPGKGFVSTPGIILIAGYLVLAAFTVIHGLVVLWPPNRDQEIDQIKNAIKQSVAEAAKGPSDSGNQTPTAGKPATNSPGGSEGAPPAADGTTDMEQPLAQSDESQSSGFDNTSGEAGDQSAEDSGTGSGDEYCASRDQKGQKKATFLWVLTLCLSPEERLFLIIVFAGALGGLGHALRSIYWYIGNRELVWSWLAMYIFLPIHGATLAIIFYLVIRGGFFSPQSTVSDTSPFGFAAVAVLIGMFTSQASEKLREIAETVLAKPPQGKNPALPPPKVTGIDPVQGSMAGGEAVKVTGTGFAKGATVKFGGQSAKDVAVADDEKTLTAVTPPSPQPGQVSVEVINPDNQSVSFMGFTYQSQTLLAPKVTGIDPPQGTMAGGERVTITGTGFSKGLSVKFGGVSATDVAMVNDTTLTAVTPPAQKSGQVSVEVINPDNQSVSFTGFEYQ